MYVTSPSGNLSGSCDVEERTARFRSEIHPCLEVIGWITSVRHAYRGRGADSDGVLNPLSQFSRPYWQQQLPL